MLPFVMPGEAPLKFEPGENKLVLDDPIILPRVSFAGVVLAAIGEAGT